MSETETPQRPIRSFRGEHAFLSNFWVYPQMVRGEHYPTAEHAFQALKTDDPLERDRVRLAPTAKAAKAAGRRVTLRAGWAEGGSIEAMRETLATKFDRYSEPAALLLATGDRPLVEGNGWHDNFWGECTCPGCADRPKHNWLGRLLEERRAELQGAQS